MNVGEDGFQPVMSNQPMNLHTKSEGMFVKWHRIEKRVQAGIFAEPVSNALMSFHVIASDGALAGVAEVGRALVPKRLETLRLDADEN